MGEELNPSSAPKIASNDTGSANTSNDKRKNDPSAELTPRHRKPRKWLGLTPTKRREFLGFFVLVPWVWTEFVDSHNFWPLFGLASTLAIAHNAMLSFWSWKSRKLFLLFWLVSIIPLAVVVCINSKPLPKPEFVFGLQLGELPTDTVVLTNDFLFRQRTVKYADLLKGAAAFHTYVDGCVMIPVRPGETNKVFTVAVVNISPVTVNDLQVVVGFPDSWKIGFDSSKWRKARLSFEIPKWLVTVTNVQFLEFQCPEAVFAGDTISCPPFTNACIPEYIDNTFKGGFIQLIVRCTDFERTLAANTIFIPVGTNSIRPFVTRGVFTPDGKMNITPTPQEIEQATEQ
jgi:hypothetical protein